MSSNDDEIKKQLIVAQYYRLADEYKQYDQTIWQIPTVAITITSAVFAVAFNFIHNNLISGIVLLLGSFFDLTLLIALAKHRMSQDVRSVFLENMEKEYGLLIFPAKTKDALEYLSKKSHKHISFKFLRKQNAFRFLSLSVSFFVISLFLIGIIFIISYFTKVAMIQP